MRRITDSLAFLMLLLSSGAVVQLIMDGGARSQGLSGANPYSGPLNYLPIFWQVAVLAFIGVVVVTARQRRYFRVESAWLVLLGLSFASSLWAEYAKVSLKSAVLMLLAFLLVKLHVELNGWERVVSVLRKTFALFLLLSVAAILVVPSYGVSVGDHEGKWQGVFVHKNTLGSFAAMAFVFYLWNLTIRRSWWTIGGAALSMALVIGSGSTTGLMNLVLSTVLFVLLRFSLTRRLLFKWRYAIVALLAVGCISMLYLSLGSNQYAIGDKDTSFSDRNLIWAYILSKVEGAPWLGYGLEQIGASVLANDADFLSHVGFVVGTAHNGFIETLHALGLAGLTVVIVLLVRLLRLKGEGAGFEFVFLYLLFFVLLNMFESKLLGFNVFFIMLMYVAQLTAAMSRSSAQPASSPNYKEMGR